MAPKKKSPTPKNKALYSRVKSEAKRKFDVYPSAYANAWLVKTYKKFQACGRTSTKSKKRKYPKCVPRSKAKSMTAAQRKSAVTRKRAKSQGVGGKPTNVKTFVKKKKTVRKKVKA